MTTALSSTSSTSSTSSSTNPFGPALQSLGIGSGLDVNAIISGLMAINQQPMTLLQQAAANYQTHLSTLGQLQSLTATMQDAAQAAYAPTLWNGTLATSSDSTSVTASTTDGSVPGNYSVSVSALAAVQTVTSTAAAGNALNAGTLTIQLGTYSTDGPPPTSFTANPSKSAVTVTIPAGSALSDVANAINGANAGVTATIINDASGSRLSLSSTSTGLSNAFTVSATETTDDGNPATGLSALTYNATQATNQMSLNQSAANAAATINGISINSESNTLANVANGLTLNLQKVTTAPVAIGVNPDTASIQTALQSFVTAFNAVASFIETNTAYDSTTSVAGPLQGDGTVNGFQTQLRNIINQGTTASTVFPNLSDMGISMQPNGTLAINQTQLTTALGNLPEMKKAMATYNGLSPSSGFMASFGTLAQSVLGYNGSLTTEQSALQTNITNNSNDQASLQLRLNAEQAALTAQYSALDTTMSSMNALSSYVQSQFGSSSSSSG